MRRRENGKRRLYGNSFLALGSARFNLGENEGTVAEYQRAVELGAGSPEMDVHLGLAYFELGYYDKAVEWLQSGVSQNPEDFQLRRALGVSLYAHGQPEQAVEHLNKAITLGTDRPDDEMVDIYYALGGCYFEKQDYEQAIGFYAQAQELDPEGQAVWADEARANLDEAYLELGQSVMKEALLDLDFANIVTEGDETYAVAKTGQAVKIEGAVHLVDGPRAGSQALVVEEGTSNECQNPTFETDANHWSSASLGSVARTTQDARYGDASLQCFSGEGQSYMQGSYSGGVPAFDTSVDYVVSAWYKLEDLPPGGNVRFMAYWMGGSHSDVSANVTVGASEADGWHQVSAVLTPDYNDRTDAGFYMRIEGATADGQSFLLDGFQIERGQDYPTSYCDGDQGDGYSWSGTPHASISTRTATTVSLDDHVGLISRNETSSFRIVAQMPYDADVAWPSTLAYLLDAAGDDDTHKRIILGYSSTKDRFEGFIHGGTRITTAPQTFRAGDWLEFVLTLDFSSNSYNLYINGELAGSSTENLAVESLTEWVLGSVYVGTSNWGGLAFSDFTVFDTLLTADEVTALYRTNSSASE
jgi:Tfp pilus assembly protein PilF